MFSIGIWSGLHIPSGKSADVDLSSQSRGQRSSDRVKVGLAKQQTSSNRASTSSNSQIEWAHFPANLVRETVGLRIEPLLASNDTEAKEIIAELWTKAVYLNDEEISKVSKVMQKKLKHWAQMEASTVITEQRNSWRIRGISSDAQRKIHRELELELEQILGPERRHILNCLFYSSLERYLRIENLVVSLDDHIISFSMNHSGFHYNLDDMDPESARAILFNFARQAEVYK
jgi:hypothetical protein